MTSFENIDTIELNSLIQITSVSGLDESLDNCRVNDLAIVIDKDYIKNRIKRIIAINNIIIVTKDTVVEM